MSHASKYRFYWLIILVLMQHLLPIICICVYRLLFSELFVFFEYLFVIRCFYIESLTAHFAICHCRYFTLFNFSATTLTSCFHLLPTFLCSHIHLYYVLYLIAHLLPRRHHSSSFAQSFENIVHSFSTQRLG